MSEPHDPPPTPPPLPHPSPVLPYSQAPAGGLPMVAQAVFGTIITGPVLVVATCFVLGFGSAFANTNTSTYVLLSIGVVLAIAALVTILIFARRLRKSERSRGWAIGIYIGLGLFGLFWGTCGLLLYSLSSGSFH